MEEILKPRSGQNVRMLCIHAHKLFIVYYTIRKQSVECISGNKQIGCSPRLLEFTYHIAAAMIGISTLPVVAA